MNGVENCSVLDSRKTESESQGLGLLQFLRAPHSDCISQGSSWDERSFVLSLISVEHPLDVFKDFSQEELEMIKLFLWKYYCGLLHFIPLPMPSSLHSVYSGDPCLSCGLDFIIFISHLF